MSIDAIGSAAQSAALSYNLQQGALDASYAQLSSGKRINSAADDPSGLAIYQELTAQADGLEQATNNISDAQDVANVASGSLGQISQLVSQLNTLAVAGSSDLLSPGQRQALQDQANQFIAQINTEAQDTTFNGVSLLQGQTLNVQTGSAEGATTGVQFGTVDAATLGVGSLDLSSTASSEQAIAQTQAALNTVSAAQARAGAQVVTLGVDASNDQTNQLNLTASASNISDLNYAAASTQNAELQNQQDVTTAVLAEINKQGSWIDTLV